jgi:hypothetical protein
MLKRSIFGWVVNKGKISQARAHWMSEKELPWIEEKASFYGRSYMESV